MKTAYFVRTDRVPDENLGRQAALVFSALEAKPEGTTLDEVTSFITENGLVTRQEPSRIAIYYLAIFKKRGWVVLQDAPVVVEVPVTEETETEEIEEPVAAE